MYSCYLRIKYNNPYRVMRIPSFKVTAISDNLYSVATEVGEDEDFM